jgi:hypothetical protein
MLSGAVWANVVKMWVRFAIIALPERPDIINNGNFAINFIDDTPPQHTAHVNWFGRKVYCR